MPIFSILTPSWNRAAYLERVWRGLNSQTFRNFEWIVADDGSTDETEEVVRLLAAQSNFPVTYIRADKHVGKARMDNEAVRQAKGELVLWCDSDDWLLPNATTSLWHAWCAIPQESKDGFVGLTALASTEAGTIANPIANISARDVSWNDLVGTHCLTGDMLFVARADALKEHPFREVDLVIPESVVWTTIGHRATRLIPEVLKMVEYRSEHAISFSGNMSYSRGRAHALATSVRNLRSYPRPWRVRAWRLITFIRYSLHGEISLREMQQLWDSNSKALDFWLAFPLACAMAIKDRLQGKVRKTHRAFLDGKNAAHITTTELTNGVDAN